MRRRAQALFPLGVFSLLLLSTVSACRPAAGREAAKLDSELLAAIDRTLAPVPRFSGQTVASSPNAPFESTTCPAAFRAPAAPILSGRETEELRALGEKIERLTNHRVETPGLLRLQALWTLLARSGPEGIDRVVRLFQAARARETMSRERTNDLAASLLLRGELKKQPEDFAAALDLLEPLVHEQRPADAVLANDAYALQCLTLGDAAATAWRRLWGREDTETAESHRTAPAQAEAAPLAPASADPMALRRQGEWLLGEWATHSLARQNEEAAASLHQAEEIGSALAAKGGDRLLLEAASIIRRDAANPARLRLLEKGHSDFHSVRGRAIYSQCHPETLSRAKESLDAAGSPFAGWVRLDQAVCAYFEKNFSAAEAILIPLRQQAEREHFLSLQGRAEWMLGLIRMVQARFVEADHHYATAIDLFTRLGEDAHAVYLRSLRAKEFEFGGAPAEAWRERLAALTNRKAVTDPERRYTIFQEAAQAMRKQGLPFASLAFLTEQMQAAEAGARETGNPDLQAYSLLARASLLDEIGRPAEAIADLANAEAIWARLPPENESRQRLRVDLDVQRSSLGRTSRPEATLQAVDRGLFFFGGRSSSLGDQIEILRLYQLRAKSHLGLGRIAAARADLLRGIEEVERQRLEIAEMEDRARFLSQGRRLFIDLIRLSIDDLKDPLGALTVLERSSNRVFTDTARIDLATILAKFPPERWASTLMATLPTGSLAVRYGHLPDRLLIWTFLDGTLELEQRRISEEQIRSTSQSCRNALAHSLAAKESEAACDAAARLVLPSRLQRLTPGRTVVLIPDEILSSLPFGPLRPSPQAPYLAETFRLMYCPGLVACLSEAAEKASAAPGSILFVTDPAFSKQLFPQLPRLPATRLIASNLSQRSQNVEVLAEEQATKAAVLVAIRSHDILEFDGHGIVNPEVPERGGLLLAPPDPATPDLPTSLLTAEDLTPAALHRLRLVILGACSTGLTSYRDTNDAAGLTATFLARGVPEVIAASWEVPDRESAILLDSFHRELAAGKSPVDALHAAQRALLHSPDPLLANPRTWAAFQLFRGGQRNRADCPSNMLKQGT